VIYAFVRRERAEEFRKELSSRGLLGRGALREGGLVGFPLVGPLPQDLRDKFSPSEKALSGRWRENLNWKEAVRGTGFPRSFDLIGDLALVRLKPGTPGVEQAKLLMKLNPEVKGVFARQGALEGEYRISPLRHLAGVDRTLTTHRENGFAFVVDVAQTFFSPRLATERARVCQQVRPGERVLDMFAGVGPFSVQAASRGAVVLSSEINPVAGRLLLLNAKLNGVASRVRYLPGDASRVANGQARGWAQRIIMNLPGLSTRFLADAIASTAASGAIINIYVRSEKDPSEELKDLGLSILQKRQLKEVSSSEKVYALDLHVPSVSRRLPKTSPLSERRGWNRSWMLQRLSRQLRRTLS